MGLRRLLLVSLILVIGIGMQGGSARTLAGSGYDFLQTPAFHSPAGAVPQSQLPFVPSRGQKGVKISTDVIAIALPAAALIGTLCERDWKGLIMGVETAAVTAAATYLLKFTVREWRPDHSNRQSFPSGHSAVSFASAAYLQRRYGWAFGAPAYALSCYVAWGRVFSKRHYWWDTVAGAAIGIGSAYIFTKPFAREHNLQIASVTDGESIGVYASFTF